MKNIFDPLYELLTKLNESNESIISNKLLDTLKIVEDCTSCAQRYNYYYLFYESLNELKKISEELRKKENKDRKAEIIHKLGNESNKLDVEINRLRLCDGCQKENIFDPLCELLTKLNESNASINSNKLLDTLKIIEDCTKELDKEENEDRKAEIIHKLSNELNKLDVKINRLRLCYGCQKKNILNPLYELLIKLNESNESIISNKLLGTLKIIEDCTSCSQIDNYYYLFYESLNELKKISEKLDKEENEDRKTEIIHQLGDELNKLDVEIIEITLCYWCQEKNILNPLYELLIKLNESNESIISNKLLDTLKIIKACASCAHRYNYYYLFYESLNELKKISEELDDEENEDREVEIIHKLNDELNKLDVKINKTVLCDSCQEEKIFNSLNELLTKLNESNESINSNQLLDTLKIIEDCTSCKKYIPRYNYYLFYVSLNKLKIISEELGKEENEDRKTEIIHKLNDELIKLDVKTTIVLCDGCQKENIFDPLCELLTKLNESNASINSNKLLDTLKIIEDCTGCKKCAQKNYFDLFYESLNKLKKDLEELDKEENEDREAEMIHKLSGELNELDVEINRIALCHGCQEKNIFNPLCKLLTKLNESNEPINSNKLLDTLKILENCTGCKKYIQKNNSDLFYKSLNKLKKISEELDKEENEDRKAEIIHKL
ncbi:9294_t:CDS:2, partial [Entrophospora sp. SA101]